MEAQDNFIYFVQPEGGGLIKIGRAADPAHRLRDMQVGCPLLLRLCRTEKAPRSWETRLHQAFAAFRVHGEWFKPHPLLANIADAIPDESLAGDALDLVNVTATESLFVSMWFERPAEPQAERSTDPLDRFEASPRRGQFITARPEDMAPKSEWAQSSAEAREWAA